MKVKDLIAFLLRCDQEATLYAIPTSEGVPDIHAPEKIVVAVQGFANENGDNVEFSKDVAHTHYGVYFLSGDDVEAGDHSPLDLQLECFDK